MKINLKETFIASNNCFQNRATLKGVLMDFYPQQKREINTLLAIFDSGIPLKMLKENPIITNLR